MTERRLLPLAAQPLKGREREARDEASAHRLRQAWGLVVGPALVKRTRLLYIRNGRLVIGCWQPEWIASAREAAAAAWPQVQPRIQRLLGVRLAGLEVVPCDPPEPESEITEAEDPFKALLAKYRELGGKAYRD